MDLAPGDTVTIVRPNNEAAGPGWDRGMNEFHGTEQIVKDVLVSGEFYIEGDPREYLFSPNWCYKD